MGAVNFAPTWLKNHLGVSPFASILAMGLLGAVGGFLAHQQTKQRFAAERAAIEAKYEAKMAQLIQNAAAKRQTTH